MPAEIEYPRLQWPGWKGWFGAIGALIAIVVFLWPSLSSHSLGYRVCIILVIVLGLWGLFLCWHGYRCLATFVARGRAYLSVLRDLRTVISERDIAYKVVEAMIAERKERGCHAIDYCYMSGNRAMIALKKKRGSRLCNGASLTLVEDGGVIVGMLTVVKENGSHYHARADAFTDALWLGYMKQAGATQSMSPPGAFAMYLPNQGEANEQGNA